MREIKFRIWGLIDFPYDLSKGDWLSYDNPEQFLKSWWSEETFCGMGYTFDDYDTDIFTIMQYTGFKDKNNKEIFEGDIIRLSYANSICYSKRNHPDAIVSIIFESGSFWLKGTVRKAPLCDYYLHDLQVIGNIYENPDLLEKT